MFVQPFFSLQNYNKQILLNNAGLFNKTLLKFTHLHQPAAYFAGEALNVNGAGKNLGVGGYWLAATFTQLQPVS